MSRIPWLLLCILASGCFGGAAPRTFVPAAAVSDPLGERPAGALVRLRRVDASSFLDERIAWRGSDVEVGVYEDERWSEPPVGYVRRALGRELFERRGHRRGGPRSPFALDVEVRVFEEVLEPKHQVRIVLWLLLVDEEDVALLERTLEVTQPVAAEEAEAMARAMGAALGRVTGQVGDQVEAALRDARRGQ